MTQIDCAVRRRLQYLDAVRGFAMICIVLGHLGIADINRFVFTFHLPIFYLITGYFINKTGSYREFVKKKFRTLIVPYGFTCAVMILLAVLMQKVFVGHGSKAVLMKWIRASLYAAGDSYQEPFYIPGIGAIWFLWSTFWGALLLRWLTEKTAGVRIAAVLVLLFVTESSRTLFWFPLSIQTAGTALMFMYFGYLFREAKPRLAKLPDEGKTAGFLFGCFMWAEFVAHFKSFWLVHADLGRGIGDIAASLCACGILLVLFRKLEEKQFPGMKPLSFLGQYSIMMLCAHIIELNLFPWYKLKEVLVISGIREDSCIYFIIGGKLIWSAAMTWIMARCSVTRRIFGFSPDHEKA